jgi:hypothetical protein
MLVKSVFAKGISNYTKGLEQCHFPRRKDEIRRWNRAYLSCLKRDSVSKLKERPFLKRSRFYRDDNVDGLHGMCGWPLVRSRGGFARMEAPTAAILSGQDLLLLK